MLTTQTTNPMEAFSYEYFSNLFNYNRDEALAYAEKFGAVTGDLTEEQTQVKPKAVSIPTQVWIPIDYKRIKNDNYFLTQQEIKSIIDQYSKDFDGKQYQVPPTTSNVTILPKIDEDKPKTQEKAVEENNNEYTIEEMRAFLKEKGVSFSYASKYEVIKSKFLEAKKN